MGYSCLDLAAGLKGYNAITNRWVCCCRRLRLLGDARPDVYL